MSHHPTPFQSAVANLAYELARLAALRVVMDSPQRCEWSDEALRLLRFDAAQAPTTWAALMERCQGRERATYALSDAEEQRVPTSCDLSIRAGDGGWMQISMRMQRVDAAIAILLQDTSHLHERENELLRAGESRDRLHQLGRWSLLGEMASGLAHEINQPLAAISAFAQAGERMLALTPPKIERAGTLFGEIAGQALRAGDVVQRMRNLIKRQASSPQKLAAKAVLADFKSLAEALARTHQVQLEIIESEDSATVLVDPAHMQQILMSLLRNALDAMRELPAAERRVRIEAQTINKNVVFSVTDSGPGISPEVARELFRPFFTTKPDGTGLGLSVCRSIIAEHGGTLQFVNTTPGVRFSVQLPLAS